MLFRPCASRLTSIAGSRISGTIISRSTTVPTRPNAAVAKQENSTLVNHGSSEKIAGRYGSSTWVLVEQQGAMVSRRSAGWLAGVSKVRV